MPFVSKISETAQPPAIAQCPSQLLNFSTRLRVLTGDSALIAGLIISGPDNKRGLFAGIGRRDGHSGHNGQSDLELSVESLDRRNDDG